MSEAEKVAMIAGGFTVINGLLVAFSRWLSHKEHKGSDVNADRTENKVDQVLVFMNGGLEERIKKAVQEAINKK